MKKVAVTLGLIISLSQFAVSENIDGTLAVDTNVNTLANSQNSVNNIQPNQQLSANLDNNVNTNYDTNAKDAVVADSVPIATTNNISSYLEGPFVGVEGSAVISAEADGKDTSGMSLGLRFGAQNVEWRTMAILEKYGSSEDYNDYIRALLQIDYYFLGSDNLMLDTFAIRPYAGVNAGGLSLDTQSENVKTITYGGQVGATMNVTNNIDLDIGYRYNLATSDLVDHTSNITVGLHYKY